MIILRGKELADEICRGLKQRVDKLIENDIHPCLNIVVTGTSNQASESYIKSKLKRAKEIGIDAKVIHYDLFGICLLYETLLNRKNTKTPTIFEMPVYIEDHALKLFEERPFIDIDGFAIHNMGCLLTNRTNTYYPCTPKGILRLLDAYKIPVEGKNVTILGRSNIVGRPLAAMMLNRNATVTVCHSNTSALAMKQHCINADIIVSATGIPNLVTRDMVSQNAVVIDAGMNRNAEGKLCGDVDFENVAPICSYITPVPKGVGPMTVAMLMENVVDYYETFA